VFKLEYLLVAVAMLNYCSAKCLYRPRIGGHV
jgi:hypothetical protein